MERKLAALFSADVQGYSRLMSEDDVATVQTITAYRAVMTALIHQYRGRVVDSPGDNLLAEFASAVDAVQCAVAVQEEIKLRNTELPPSRRMVFRIGINLGDVLVDGDRLYGDGVNIAARIEGLADGGGLCISGTVYDQVVTKLALTYEDLGEQRVKNISRPVRVYRVLSASGSETPTVVPEGGEGVGRWRKTIIAVIGALTILVGAGGVWYFWPVESPDSGTLLAAGPSIAVLAFDNMSGASQTPQDGHLGDSLSENIIAQLAKIPQMLVIARNSAFTYKGKPVSVQQVGRELGVRYVLEGSVQKVAEQVRITAQLIDAATGVHLWAEQYDRRLTDLFAIQDEIALKVAKSLQIKLTQGEKSSLLTHSTDSLEAWAAAMRSLQHYSRFTMEDNTQAQQLLKQAIAIDPGFAWAYAQLGWTYWQAARRGWSREPDAANTQAWSLAEQSLAIHEGVSLAHALKSRLHVDRKEFDAAISEGRWALELEPNNPDMHMNFAWRLMYVGRPAEAVAYMEKAKRLHPHHPHLYFFVAGRALYLSGRYEEARVDLQKWLTAHPNSERPNVNLAAVYAALGRESEARAQAAEVLRKNSEFSATQYAALAFGNYKDPQVKSFFLQHLRQAGLPD